MSVLVVVAAAVLVQALPQVTDLRICRVTFDPPKVVRLDNENRQYTTGIEFIVDTTGEVPPRAYGPAVFVGDVELNQGERLTATRWRFLAFETAKLVPGAAISWGWMKDRVRDRVATRFRFELASSCATDGVQARSSHRRESDRAVER